MSSTHSHHTPSHIHHTYTIHTQSHTFKQILYDSNTLFERRKEIYSSIHAETRKHSPPISTAPLQLVTHSTHTHHKTSTHTQRTHATTRTQRKHTTIRQHTRNIPSPHPYAKRTLNIHSHHPYSKCRQQGQGSRLFCHPYAHRVPACLAQQPLPQASRYVP